MGRSFLVPSFPNFIRVSAAIITGPTDRACARGWLGRRNDRSGCLWLRSPMLMTDMALTTGRPTVQAMPMTAVRIGTVLAPSSLAPLLSPGDLPYERGKARSDPGPFACWCCCCQVSSRAFPSVVVKYSSRSRRNFSWVALNLATCAAISSRSRASRSFFSFSLIAISVDSRPAIIDVRRLGREWDDAGARS